jgi:hypothetical protein
MPRLSGDSGDLPEEMNDTNHRERWSSLTELQYDRMAKWAEGIFKPGTRFESSETIHSKLTRAALKWTTGAPLFPGIEMYWVAELSPTYNQKIPFRFHEAVNPGDLTKGLSLPWQADFYMCRTHWWPHVRPDDIVTQATWMEAVALKETPAVPADSNNLTKRNQWHEGLQTDPDDERVGITEMVKKWTKLGFITQVQLDPLIFVETERTLVREGVYTITNVGQNKGVGSTSSDNRKRPVEVVSPSQIWHIEYVQPLRKYSYRLVIADFTAATNDAATDDGTKVDAYDGIFGRYEWVIEATANTGEYTIATNGQKYWTLGPNDTQVTVAAKANNFANQIWKLDLSV